ncbi:MAG: protein kinase domain-containing protein, partial [Planctomycetota bacterium]
MDEFEISGQLLGDRYAVVKKLGTTRLSSVFLAMDREGDGLVVVKVPRPELLEDSGFRERYTDGMRDLFENPRPGVVKTLDTGTFVTEEDEGVPVPFVIFEYLEGGSLEDRLSRGSMGPAEVLAWLPQVAKTLDSLHAEEILHRDVRPESILFDTEERPFLSDFAIAKALPKETGFTLPGGADDYGYTPPEVLSGTIGSAHDQYSLAAVVFRCVTGRRLFPHDPYLGVWNVLSTHLPGEAASVVEKALSVEPGERFGSCTEFAEALAEKVEGDESASSEEEATRAWTAPEIARKMDPAPELRRGRLGMILVAIGAAAVLAVVGFFVLSGPGTDGGTSRVDPDPIVGKEPPPDEPPPDEPPAVPPVAPQPPSIVISEPATPTITPEAQATVRGRVSGGNQVVVIVNETRVVPDDDGNFEVAMDLDDGSNTLLVRWMDGEGNLGQLHSISVTRDGKAPTLMVTSPDDGDLTSDGLTVLAGTLTDENPAGVLVNGKQREIEKDGSFSFDFPLEEGENRFVVEAIDRAGNRAPVVTRVITKDGLAPELSIEAPTDAILTSGETVEVTGKAVDARLERLTVNERPVEPRADGSFVET